jgi:hypothetical protein
MSKNKALSPIVMPKAINPNQGVLDLQITKQIEIDGVGMGVLSDGTPFLSGRGLARLAGINNARIVELSAEWDSTTSDSAVNKIKAILASRGVNLIRPHIEIKQRSGNFYAYTDVICLAVQKLQTC